MAKTKVMILAVAAFAASAGVARADEASERELRARLAEVEQRLKDVERGGYFTASTDLEARVADLERAADDKGAMVGYFKQGWKNESSDGAHKYQVFGRIQNDWFWFDAPDEAQDEFGEMNGGTELRRIRLGVGGTLYGNVEFKFEIDFAGAAVSVEDMYMELKNCSFGTVRVGHFDEPFSFDRVTSSRFHPFIERSSIADGIAPQRNTGIMVYNTFADAYLYQLGVFRDTNAGGNDIGNAKSGEYNITGRISGRPVIADDGATWLHLGIAGSYRDFSDDVAQFRARPDIRQAPRFADTGAFGANDGTLLGLEAGYNTGPFGIQAEYAHWSTSADDFAVDTDDHDGDAFTAWVTYWLTGETNAYSVTKGSLDRPKIKKNYGDGDGVGGWQLALRYDTFDVQDGDFAEDESFDTWTAGVNWFLNPNTRISMNVVHVDPDRVDEDVNALVMRFQVDF